MDATLSCTPWPRIAPTVRKADVLIHIQAAAFLAFDPADAVRDVMLCSELHRRWQPTSTTVSPLDMRTHAPTYMDKALPCWADGA